MLITQNVFLEKWLGGYLTTLYQIYVLFNAELQETVIM
jgi:hypothetical protein